MAKKKKSKEQTSKVSYGIELKGIVLILIGIISFGFGPIGALGKKFSMFLAGSWYFVILISLIIIGFYMIFKRKMPNFLDQKLIGLYLLFIVILVFSHYGFLENPKHIINITYNNFMERIVSISGTNALATNGTTTIVIGGGLIGAVFLNVFYSLLAKTGTTILLVLLSILSIILLFDITLSDLFKNIYNFIKHLIVGEKKKTMPSAIEDAPVMVNEEVEEEPKEIEKPKVIITSMDEIRQKSLEEGKEKEEEKIEIEEERNDDNVNLTYRLPKIQEIFAPLKVKKVNSNDFTKSSKETLERVLKDFGIKATVVEIHVGPAVTEYELIVPAGTKVNKILTLNKEIALALAAKDVLIQAPIPGKNTIGVEIPNPEISSVSLREVLESSAFIKSDAKICAALGKDIMGTPKVFDLTKTPHLLVAGSTGSGKSVCINAIIASILMRYKPNEVKLVLVDPKKVELTNYNGIPHLLCPVVCDPKKASLTLQKVCTEMDNRFQLFSDHEVKNIAGYNEWVEKENKKQHDMPIAKMPYLVVIIDELADLMLVASKEVEDSIARITQLARAAGIHLIVATQRPSTDVITGLIKNNIPSRIAFAVASQIDSRTILDQPGADKLLGKGDMLFYPMGESHPIRVQGCYVSDEEIKNLIDFCKKQGSASYDETFTNVSQNSSSGSSNSDVSSNDDEAYNDVVEFAIQNKAISASLIQRRFRFGYNRAARMIDLLEARGIVGPANGSKPREVLVKLQENDKEE